MSALCNRYCADFPNCDCGMPDAGWQPPAKQESAAARRLRTWNDVRRVIRMGLFLVSQVEEGIPDAQVWKHRFVERFSDRLKAAGYEGDDHLEISYQHADAASIGRIASKPEEAANAAFEVLCVCV